MNKEETETKVTISPRDELIINVKRWVMIDKQLKIITEKTRELRELKHKSSSKICDYLTENPNLKNSIGITGGELCLYQKKEYSPLTFGYIEKCLGELIPNKEQVDFLVKYLKDKREIVTVDDLRLRGGRLVPQFDYVE